MSQQPTFNILVQDYIKSITADHNKAKELFKAQDRTSNVNLAVCQYKFDEEKVEEPEDFESIQNAHNIMSQTLKEYQGLMEHYRIIPDVSGWSDGDGGIEIDYVELNCELTYYVPYSDEDFKSLITENTYDFRKNFKIFIDNKLFNDSTHTVYQRPIDCKILELFKNEILDYKSLLKATYTDCKI